MEWTPPREGNARVGEKVGLLALFNLPLHLRPRPLTFKPENPSDMNDFFNRFADFFATLTNEQTIFLGFLSFIVFFFGIVVGWIVQGTKTRRFKKEMMVLRKDRDLFEQQYRTADEQRKKTAKELEAVSREKVDALDQVQGLRTELRARENELVPLQSRVEELEAINQSYVINAEALNDKIALLEQANEDLAKQNRNGGAAAGAGSGEEAGKVPPPPAYPPPPASLDTNEAFRDYFRILEKRFQYLDQRLRDLAVENATLRAGGSVAQPSPPASLATDEAFLDYSDTIEQRFQQLDQRLLDLAVENATLRAGGSVAPPENPTLTPEYEPVIPPAVATDANGEPLVIRADTTEPGARTGGGGNTEVVVQTTPSTQVPLGADGGVPGAGYDDLTRIQDIGPFLQAKLNEHDITRYEQIANWTEADIMTYTELIGYLPGIIQRDDWMGQARAFLSGDASDPQPYTGSPVPVAFEAEAATDEDNLRLIEGIGPKIESILRASGITTFEQLADADADALRSILEEAGSRFKSHNPKSWPAQAGLAADGKMDELRAWQRELKG